VKNRLIVLLLSAFICVAGAACAAPADDNNDHDLAAAWTVSTVVTTNPAIENFSPTLVYSHTADGGKDDDVDVYTAPDVSLIVNGTPAVFDITATQTVGSTSVYMVVTDGASVLILSGSVAGDTITGAYGSGTGVFSAATGTFTAVR